MLATQLGTSGRASGGPYLAVSLTPFYCFNFQFFKGIFSQDGDRKMKETWNRVQSLPRVWFMLLISRKSRIFDTNVQKLCSAEIVVPLLKGILNTNIKRPNEPGGGGTHL